MRAGNQRCGIATNPAVPFGVLSFSPIPHPVPMPSPQRQLFDTEPEPWEADDQAEQLVAGVVLSAGPAQEFDYLVPDALRETAELGRRVKVPLGPSNRLVVGYCVRLENRPAGRRRLKPLHSVLDQRSLLVAGHAAADPLDRRLLPLRLGVRVGRRGAGRRARRRRHADGHAVVGGCRDRRECKAATTGRG